MARTLLLTFIHGFKGDTKTFFEFPAHLKQLLEESLVDDVVETAIYPKYETSGDLAKCTDTLLIWLTEQVDDLRKKRGLDSAQTGDVAIILIAHSMGGLVASDALFSLLDSRGNTNSAESLAMLPLVKGLLAFDTPYNGLARSMFVYGAFSHYHKVSSVWNMMTAASAGLLSAKSLTTASKGTLKTASASGKSLSRNPQWRMWQTIAVRSGTVGAIAAGGVAAYMNREMLLSNLKSLRNINKTTIKESAAQGYDAIGQGLAYINRDSVGESFAWFSSHFKFVGALMQQQNMNRRLERLRGLKGVGVKNIYTSLGKNGYWSGGYFVPERTFCAVPAAGKEKSKEKREETPEVQAQKVAKPEDEDDVMWFRNVNSLAEDEVKAHTSMFRSEMNDGYEAMSNEARDLILVWVKNTSEITDTKPFPPGSAANPIMITDDGEEIPSIVDDPEANDSASDDDSPLDIAAVAAAVPLPEDDEATANPKQTYLRGLLRIANNAGSGLVGLKGMILERAVRDPKVAPEGNATGSAAEPLDMGEGPVGDETESTAAIGNDENAELDQVPATEASAADQNVNEATRSGPEIGLDGQS